MNILVISKVVKFGKERKIIELPKAVRGSFSIGENVLISKKEVDENGK